MEKGGPTEVPEVRVVEAWHDEQGGCEFFGFRVCSEKVNTVTKEDEMTETSRQPKDKNYNLISALYQASDNVETFKTYAQDAQTEGDQELARFLRDGYREQPEGVPAGQGDARGPAAAGGGSRRTRRSSLNGTGRRGYGYRRRGHGTGT